MARRTKNQSFEPVITAAQEWVRNCLIADNSVFASGPLWTPRNVAEVRSAFVDHPDEGKDDFSTKLKGQMASASPSAKRLMAEMVWVLLLFPSNIKVSTKRKQVGDLWSMSGEALAEGQLLLSDDVLAGIGSGGPGFNTHRWREMVFLISLVGDLKKRPAGERQKLMSEYEAFVDWIAQVPQEGHRQLRHMLRYFCSPDRVERMSSNRERWAVLVGFGVALEKDVKKWSDQKLDDALFALRKSLQDANPSEVLDFYEDPLRDRWHAQDQETTGDEPEDIAVALRRDPDVSFSKKDCEVFARYPNSVSWGEVQEKDQALFKSIRSRLKALSEFLVANVAMPIPMQAETSLPTPNGRSPKEIWSCVYPLAISNKSYGLQVALIISERGAEVCFCQGSGTSQVADPAKKQELEGNFANMRRRLASVPQELVAAVEKSEKKEWFYRKSWLTKPNETDFTSLTEWLAYASGPEGSAASVSLYCSPAELETLGTGIFDAFQDTSNTFGPILRAVYSTPASSRHWIFQGNPDQFDVDGYIRDRQEVLWSVRQHKDRILAGDKVLLWRSGAIGGVIADCSVIDPPSKEILEDAPELWKEKPDLQTGEMRCRLRVENSFADTPIARAAIRASLPELSIVKQPQGTNYEITQLDYEKIIKLRGSTIHEPLDAKTVNAFEQALRDAGVVVSRMLVIRMLSSLASKNLVLLTGLAGSGKTKIAQALARWLPSSSNCIRVVAVGADWTGNENVLGYPNGLEKTSYVSKPSLDVILHAKANQATPHFLILDEMNLSHVERYFADILSAIESDEQIHLHQDAERKANGTTIPADVELPKNLFIIGTVNVDETTYMFSPKVLDRANVIEFRMDAGELEGFLGNPAKPDLSKLDGKGAAFGKAFVDAAKNPVTVPADVKPAYDAEMLLLFKTLQAHGAEFGYRTAYETARFIHFYKLLGNHADGDTTWFPGAFDCVIFQKLLPKLHGSRAKLGPVLKKLWFLCVTPHKVDAETMEARDKLIAATLKAAEESKAEPLKDIPDSAPYPLSAEKIHRMWRLMMDNGFASFAEA